MTGIKEKNPELSLITQILASSSAAIFAELVYYPFLTIWTMQHSENLTFRNACRQIKNGKGFYAGFSLSIISAIPYAMLYLYGKDIPLRLGDNAITQALRGPAGQGLATIVHEPIAKLMALTQAAGNASKTEQLIKQRSIFYKACEIRRTKGVLSFYGAATPAFIANATSDALGYFLLGFTEKNLTETKLNPFWQIVITMLCFATAAAITAPLDVIATRIRLGKTDPSQNFLQAGRNLYAIGGARAFKRGLPACMLYHGLWGSIVAAEEIAQERIASRLSVKP